MRLVFVVNGSSEVTASELAFLVRATEAGGDCHLRPDQIDKYQGGVTCSPQTAGWPPSTPRSSRARHGCRSAAECGWTRAAPRRPGMPIAPPRSLSGAASYRWSRCFAGQISGHAGDLRVINAARVARRVLGFANSQRRSGGCVPWPRIRL